MSGAQFESLREVATNYDEALAWIVERMTARVAEFKDALADGNVPHTAEGDAKTRGAVVFALEVIEMLLDVEKEIREVKENG